MIVGVLRVMSSNNTDQNYDESASIEQTSAFEDEYMDLGEEDEKKTGNRLLNSNFHNWKNVAFLLMIYDILAVNVPFILALWLRYDCRFTQIYPMYLYSWVKFSPIYTVFCLIVFWVLRLYRSLWRYASFGEMNRILISSVITGSFHVVVITTFIYRMPITYYAVGITLQFVLVSFIRFSYRLVRVLIERSNASNRLPARRVMLIGAGEAGCMILRDINGSKEIGERVVCIIDDNRNKWNRLCS